MIQKAVMFKVTIMVSKIIYIKGGVFLQTFLIIKFSSDIEKVVYF